MKYDARVWFLLNRSKYIKHKLKVLFSEADRHGKNWNTMKKQISVMSIQST
jgi:hypothetical protein